MKKRIDIKSLICISVSLATVLSLGAMSLADELSEQEPDEETEIAYEDDTECIVEEDDEDIIDETLEEDAVIVSDFEAFEEEPEDQPEEVVISEEDVEEVSATTGFKMSGGKIYFYDQNGKMLKGWQKIDDAWWYFTSSGAAANGWQKIGTKWYYFYSGYNEVYSYYYSYYAKSITLIDDVFYCFNEDGEMLTNSWVDDHGSWYYADKNGKAVTGWQSIGGKWYHFRDFNITEYENGGYSYDYPSMDTGFIRIGEDYYYFNDNGVMQTNRWYEEKESYWGEDYSYWYYIGSDGKAVTGWHKIDGKYYFFYIIYKDESESGYVYYSKPYMASNTSITTDDKRYYVNDKGIMQTGWVNTGSDNYPSWYYFGSDGAAYTGWHKIGGKYYYFSDYGNMYRDGLRQIDDIYYYFDADGVLQTNKWIQPYKGTTYSSSMQNYWYYFDADGCAVIGWEKIDGKWYYFGEGSNSSSSSYYPYMRTSTVISQANKDGGYDYFVVGNDGSRQTGWAKVNSSWYYCGSDGKAKTGWQRIDGNWYYFSEDYSPNMLKGLQVIDGKDYIFLSNGKMLTGFGEYRGKTYYADENGVLVKDDWVKSGGKWYYMKSSGQMVTGLYTIYNQNTGRYKLYRFDSNGVCKNP